MTLAIIQVDPMESVEALRQRYSAIQTLKKEIFIDKIHYGEPFKKAGKPTLLKPGAEAICSAFRLYPEFKAITLIEDFTSGVFHYRYECILRTVSDGQIVGTGIGSCNSREEKYAYLWVYKSDLPKDANLDELEKKEFDSKSGGKYFKYRVPNRDPFSLVNTVDKMAQKRALVAATLIATGASTFFTQDVEDMPDYGGVVIEGIAEDTTDEPPAKPANGSPFKKVLASEAQISMLSHLMVQTYDEDEIAAKWGAFLARFKVSSAAMLSQEEITTLIDGLKAKEALINEIGELQYANLGTHTSTTREVSEDRKRLYGTSSLRAMSLEQLQQEVDRLKTLGKQEEPAPDEKPAKPAKQTQADLVESLHAEMMRVWGASYDGNYADYLAERNKSGLMAMSISELKLELARFGKMESKAPEPAALPIE